MQMLNFDLGSQDLFYSLGTQAFFVCEQRWKVWRSHVKYLNLFDESVIFQKKLAGETEWVRGMRDFEESMLDLGVLDCILFPSESSKMYSILWWCTAKT